MTSRDPLILEYRGPADPGEVAADEYGFIREAFGWLLVAFAALGLLIGMGWGVSMLAKGLQ